MLSSQQILITGADGFIGSHLTELLAQKGCRVRALSQYNAFNNWGWLEDVNCLADVEVVTGDVRDAHFCRRLTRGVDVIFHLAALIAIPYSYIAPASYVQTNVMGTLNICQAALDNGCRRIIHTSTSEAYGTARYVPMNEAHPLQPQSPYSASKIGADMMALSFYHAFNLPVVIARPFNTYGPRQSARAIIPTIISQIASGAKTLALGDLTPTRDLTYVKDTCRGLLALAECEEAVGQTVNIGSNYEISMAEVLHHIREIMDADVQLVTDDARRRPPASEVFRLWCDTSRLEKLTGFRPAISIRQGLEMTVHWFCRPENLRKYKPDTYNL